VNALLPTTALNKRALVLFSGGQDSATCLADALQRFAHVETLGFDYGQRHAIELSVRQDFLGALRQQMPTLASRLGDDHLLSVDVIKSLGHGAMTHDVAIEMQANGLPNTFVPGRNLLFLTLAAALAYRRGLQVLVTGVCETDYSGYPDCRDDTMKALQVALNLGLESRLTIETPLMWLDKAATWQMAERIGGNALLELIREHTHTCYLGDRSQRHAWGYGCGACPACELRKAGHEAFVKASTRA
jgi:7-cyano-7-deazaguanine synthase